MKCISLKFCMHCVSSPATLLRPLGVHKWAALDFIKYKFHCSYSVMCMLSLLVNCWSLPDVWRLFIVKVFLCLLCCFNVKTYFLQSLSHESPTKVSWIANLTPLDLSFQFLLFILNTTTRNVLTCWHLAEVKPWQCISWTLVLLHEVMNLKLH